MCLSSLVIHLYYLKQKLSCHIAVKEIRMETSTITTRNKHYLFQSTLNIWWKHLILVINCLRGVKVESIIYFMSRLAFIWFLQCTVLQASRLKNIGACYFLRMAKCLIPSFISPYTLCCCLKQQSAFSSLCDWTSPSYFLDLRLPDGCGWTCFPNQGMLTWSIVEI